MWTLQSKKTSQPTTNLVTTTADSVRSGLNGSLPQYDKLRKWQKASASGLQAHTHMYKTYNAPNHMCMHTHTET